MMDENNSKQDTQDKIPKHRQDYIDLSLKQFIKDYNIKNWPLDCVALIYNIMNKGKIKLWFKPSGALKEQEYARTIYIPDLDKYLMVVDENKLHFPLQSPVYRSLNFSLAREIARIILKHSDLPDECRDEVQRESESREAEEFARRLLAHENKRAATVSKDNEPYLIQLHYVNDFKYRISEALFPKHFDGILVLRLNDIYMKALFLLYCLAVLVAYING